MSLNVQNGFGSRFEDIGYSGDLKHVVFAMLTAMNSTTGVSPAMLTFGRQLRSLFEMFSTAQHSHTAEFDFEVLELTNSRHHELAIIYKKVADSIDRANNNRLRSTMPSTLTSRSFRLENEYGSKKLCGG